MNVVIKKSKIGQFKEGWGVFANRDFKKDEIVIKYSLKVLTKEEFKKLPQKEKKFTDIQRGIRYLYAIQERYVNHSSHPNTRQDLQRKCDRAKRNIKKGEEITTDAAKDNLV